jgi:hypothetical protein
MVVFLILVLVLLVANVVVLPMLALVLVQQQLLKPLVVDQQVCYVYVTVFYNNSLLFVFLSRSIISNSIKTKQFIFSLFFSNFFLYFSVLIKLIN